MATRAIRPRRGRIINLARYKADPLYRLSCDVRRWLIRVENRIVRTLHKCEAGL